MPRPHGTDWVLLAFFVPLILTGLGHAVLAVGDLIACNSGDCSGAKLLMAVVAATLTKSWVLVIPLLLFTLIGSRVEGMRSR